MCDVRKIVMKQNGEKNTVVEKTELKLWLEMWRIYYNFSVNFDWNYFIN